MPVLSRSVASLRHLARPRAAPSLTTAAATAPLPVGLDKDSAARLRRVLKKVKAKADESRELYDRFSGCIFPFVVATIFFDLLNQEISIMELKKSVAMLKEEKAIRAASEPESEPSVANGTSCVRGST